MMTTDAIKDLLEKKLPGAEIRVDDLTGAMDHFEVQVIWSGFKGKGLIEQHQTVHQALSDALEDGRIHALKIKTRAPL